MYVLLTTGHFDRRIVKFSRAHPDLKRRWPRFFTPLNPIPFIRISDSTRSKKN